MVRGYKNFMARVNWSDTIFQSVQEDNISVTFTQICIVISEFILIFSAYLQ